ncbi:hypothetical protein Celaphus_00017247, partial [Cervus elaphus hippelaphus]
MLESGIDRIISQVVDPKINHTFRPQVEKAVHEFLATLNHKEDAGGSTAPDDEKPDSSTITQGVPTPGPSANVASDAMSILETITSLNQEASAARASTETSNAKTGERMSKKPPSQPSTDTSAEKERTSEDTADKEKSTPDSSGEGQEAAPGSEELSDPPCPTEEMKNHTRESTSSVLLNKDAQQESSDQKSKSADKGEKKPDSNEKAERKKEKKEKTEKKIDHSKRSEDVQRVKDEKQAKDKEVECSKLPSEKTNSKAKTGEGTKEDFSLIDSDVDGLTDITVSSVHTSDLSSFEEDTEEEVVMSESMEEGEITSDDEEKNKQNKTKTQTSDPSEGKAKNVRHAYVHKPYLYSKYYSDSDDELTVEQRRQSIAKEKEERLLRRQINREKLEEKRKQKAEKTKYSKAKSQGKSSVDLEEPSTKGLEPKAPRIKEVLKERKVLEKKVALSKRRKKDSRNIDENAKKKQQPEEDSRETLKTSEHCEKEKASSSKDLKHVHAKSEPNENVQKTSQQTKLASDDKAERRSKHRNERKLSVLGKDGKPVSEYIIKTDENVRKENKKERHGSADKTKAEHKSRRSSDSKIQKDSLSSRQHGSTVQRRSESYSEDKCDNDSTNADSNSKPEEVVHKERRRTKSLLEEKLVLKTKSRSQGKQLKASETESQENTTKLATTPKPEKEKNTEEGDPERQRKSRVEDRPSEESGVDPTSESAAPSAHSVQRESGHRAKLPPAKERCKGDKESGATRLERRLSDGHKSRSLKHGSKDAKKKEDSKTEDKDGKEGDGSHEKPRGSGSVVEKKLSRRLCENRRGSVSQEMAKGEEKPAANPSGAPSSSSLQRPKKSDPALIPEQEPMEIDPEPATENAAEVRKTQDGSSSSQQDLDSENVMKQKTTTAVLREGLQTPTGDSKTASPACRSGRGTGAVGNSEKHADHRSTLTKKMHLQSSVSKPNSGEKESAQRGTHEMNVDSETSHCLLPHAPSESDRAQKNLKTTTKPTEERLAPGDATLKHSTKADPAPSLGPMAAGSQKHSHDSGVPPVVDERTGSEGATASPSLGHHSEIPRQSWTVGESEVPRTSDSREGDAVSMVDTPAEASVESRGRIPEVAQAFVPHSRQGKADTPVGSESADRTVGNEDADKEGGLMDADGKGRDSNSKHTVRASVENGDKAGAAVDQVEGMNSDPLGLEQSRGPGEAKNTPVDADRRHGHSEVDTSVGSNAVSSVLHQRSGKAETPTARPGRGEKASIASSTEGKDSSVPLNPVKAGTATTTSAEMVEGGVAVPCTSIEADEGLTTGMCSENHPLHVGAEAREGTVFAAAEEGGGVVTEGFAESETFLTSTKEGESGECAVAEPEERKTEPVMAPAGTTGADARSAASEEKDDAVTSAGSEGKCDGSSGGDSDLVEGTVTFISEVESDGAVTSAGMDIREGSLSNEELDGFQRSPRRAGPKKESEGTVTCTGAGGRRDGGVLCSAAGVGLQEQRRVTGAPGGPVDTPTPAAASAAQEESASVTDGPEGESAVTSTGITEEDAEGLASCTGSEESGEGFALSSESEENEESAMDSTVAKDPTDAPVVAAGPGDDEGVVTSTGAKEDEDEGEGVVTSTGRGNEVGHASTCTGMEEESEGGSVCESAGGDGQLGPAAGLVDAEAGGTVPHANESTVDSVSGAEKDAKDAEICSSAKGVVESSVSSGVAAEGVAAPAPEGRQGPMTSAASDRRDSELSRKEKADDTTPSTGLVGGSYEALVSAAVPEHGPPHTSPGEKEDEGVITSVENEDCDGLVAATASDSIANQAGVAGGSGEGKGLVISTSTTDDLTPQLSTVVDVGAGRSSAPRPEESAEGPRVNVEEFEAPMPSAASGDGSQLTAARNEEKDECAMISTSIGEEFEVPISSAAALHGARSPQPVAAAEDRAKGLAPDVSDAAIISTSTAECLLAPAGLDRQEEVHPSAGSPKGKDAPSATKTSPPQAPLSSLMAEDTCQCPGPSTGGEEVGPVVAGGTGEGHDPALVSMLSAGVRRVLESKGLGKDCADRVQREDERPEAGASGGSTPARCPAGGSGDSPVDPQGPEQVPEGTSVSVCCLTAVSPGAEKADDPRGPEGNLKTTTLECVNGQESEPAPSHTAALPTAYGVALSASKQEQNLTSKSDHRGQCTVPASAEKTGEGNSVTKSCQQGLQVTVSSEENLHDL